MKPLKVARLQDKISEHVQYWLLHKTTCFYFLRATEKKFNWLELFFQLLANDDVKVNKTQKVFFGIDLDTYYLNLDAINFTKWNIKRNIKFAVEQS